MRNVVVGCLTGAAVITAVGFGLIAADKNQAAKQTPSDKAAREKMPLPEYNAEGVLLRPTGYERWIVVGTSIGLGYSDEEQKDADHPGQFHNIYLQPQAFDRFVETGEFPEQTVFVVTNNPSRSTKDKGKGKSDILKQGFIADPTVGLEVAIKDTKRFPDGWAYYMFHDRTEKAADKERSAERPFARKDCYDCHAEHGAVDHVFTQYYSVLTAAREKHLAKNAAKK